MADTESDSAPGSEDDTQSSSEEDVVEELPANAGKKIPAKNAVKESDSEADTDEEDSEDDDYSSETDEGSTSIVIENNPEHDISISDSYVNRQAATKIQAAFRGHRVRKSFDEAEQLINQELEAAAKKVQASFRGFKARKHLREQHSGSSDWIKSPADSQVLAKNDEPETEEEPSSSEDESDSEEEEDSSKQHAKQQHVKPMVKPGTKRSKPAKQTTGLTDADFEKKEEKLSAEELQAQLDEEAAAFMRGDEIPEESESETESDTEIEPDSETELDEAEEILIHEKLQKVKDASRSVTIAPEDVKRFTEAAVVLQRWWRGQLQAAELIRQKLRESEQYKVSPSEKRDIKAAFKIFARGHEEIRSDQMGPFMRALGEHPSKAELAHMVKTMDANGDGFVSQEEFIAWWELRKTLFAGEELLMSLFSFFDQNNSGHISHQELIDTMILIKTAITDEEAQEMIRVLDRDFDGQISYQEFLAVAAEAL